MKKGIILFLVIVIIITGFYFFTVEKKTSREYKHNPDLIIYTSIYPLYEIAKEIGDVDENITIELIVPSGSEIHNYEPSPRSMAQLENADMFFYIGIGLEPWAERIDESLTVSGVKIVELSNYLDLIRYDDVGKEEVHFHEEGDYLREEGHLHGIYDPHVWLDPVNMKKIAGIMKDELILLDSDNRERYKENYQSYLLSLEELERDFNNILSKKNRDTIIVSHAAFGYLAERYGFRQLALMGTTPHGEPTPGSLAEIVKVIRDKDLEYVFVETLTDDRIVNVIIEETGVEALFLNPFLGLTPEELENGEDYFSIMRRNLSNLKKALVE